MSTRGLWRSVAVLAAAAWGAAPALGGELLTSAAYNDGSMVWHGMSQLDSGVTVDGKTLKVDVDWAVFAPGTFPYSGYTPPSGEFVYAYQISVTGTSYVSEFSVGMIFSNEADAIGHFALTGGTFNPTAEQFLNPPPGLDQAVWSFGDKAAPGAMTVGLVYSSVNAPVWSLGSVVDSGQYGAALVPAPSDFIPEPGSLSLVVAGLALVWRRRRA